MIKPLKISGAIGDLLHAVLTARKLYQLSFPISVDMQNDIGAAIVTDNFGEMEAKRSQVVMTQHQRCNITDLPSWPLYVLYWMPDLDAEIQVVELIYAGPLKPAWDVGYPLGNSTTKRVVRLWKLEQMTEGMRECHGL